MIYFDDSEVNDSIDKLTILEGGYLNSDNHGEFKMYFRNQPKKLKYFQNFNSGNPESLNKMEGFPDSLMPKNDIHISTLHTNMYHPSGDPIFKFLENSKIQEFDKNGKIIFESEYNHRNKTNIIKAYYSSG